MYIACELNTKPIFRSLYSVIRTWVKYNPPWINPLRSHRLLQFSCAVSDIKNNIKSTRFDGCLFD